MTAGELHAAGFRVWATFQRREHFDVQLPDTRESTVVAFLAVAGPLLQNRYYQP